MQGSPWEGEIKYILQEAGRDGREGIKQDGRNGVEEECAEKQMKLGDIQGRGAMELPGQYGGDPNKDF